MHGWKINIFGVRSVLASVARAGESLSQHEQDSCRLAEEAPEAFRPADRVSSAVSSFLAAHGDDVASSAERARRVLDASAQASAAYLDADEHMATQAELSASAAFGGR